jgi:hypothetical protein
LKIGQIEFYDFCERIKLLKLAASNAGVRRLSRAARFTQNRPNFGRAEPDATARSAFASRRSTAALRRVAEDGFMAVFETVMYLSRPGIFAATLVPDLAGPWTAARRPTALPVVGPAELRLDVTILSSVPDPCFC